MAVSVREILKEGIRRLQLADVDSPILSAELLLAEVLGLSRLDLVLDVNRAVGGEESEKFNILCSRREAGEPVAYLLGEKEFFGLAFKVTSDVLIPRPETEHVIEEIQALCPEDEHFAFADLGTGSGILAVTLAKLFPNSRGLAVDLSREALLVARENAVSHGVARRLQFALADFTRPLFIDQTLDICVSNPPYVSRTEYAGISREVAHFEPKTALVSAEGGKAHIRSMVPHVARALKPGGRVFIEMGCDHGPAVLDILAGAGLGLTDQNVIKDLAGLDRIAFAVKG